MSTQTLDAIEQDLEALDAILADLGGDITDEEVEAAIERWFEELGEARDAKLNGYARRIQALETHAEAKKAEERRLAQQRKQDESNADWLKRRLLGYVQRRGAPIKGKDTRQLETTLFRFTETKNGGAQKLTYLVAPIDLPEELRRDTVTIVLEHNQEALYRQIEKTVLGIMASGWSVTYERSAIPVESEVRAALECASEAGSWELGQTRPPELEIYRYVRLEPRGVRLAIR